MKNALFVTGIGTGVGKTLVSAVLAEAFSCAYWKPVQSGDLEQSDSMTISKLCSEKVQILPETHRLKTAASPHYSAKLDGIEITENDFEIPSYSGNILIEGAGGLLVPLNEFGLLYADVLVKWNIPIVLVAANYLGSINHTLLSLEYIKHNGIDLKLLIFSGIENQASEQAILQRFPEIPVHRIPLAETVNRDFVSFQAKRINFKLFT